MSFWRMAFRPRWAEARSCSGRARAAGGAVALVMSSWRPALPRVTQHGASPAAVAGVTGQSPSPGAARALLCFCPCSWHRRRSLSEGSAARARAGAT